MCVCVILPVPPFLECPRLSRLPPSLGSASRARCLPPETQKKAARPPFPGSLPGSSALPAGEPRAKGPGPAASRPSPANSSRGRPGSAERPRERRRGPLRPPTPPPPGRGAGARGSRSGSKPFTNTDKSNRGRRSEGFSERKYSGTNARNYGKIQRANYVILKVMQVPEPKGARKAIG